MEKRGMAGDKTKRLDLSPRNTVRLDRRRSPWEPDVTPRNLWKLPTLDKGKP